MILKAEYVSYNTISGMSDMVYLVGNVPDMSQTCPWDGDMSRKPADRIGWLAIFFAEFGQSCVRSMSSK